MGRMCGGRCLPVESGGEWSDKKNKNREGGGGSDFDGFCFMTERNNQPKSSHIVGIYLGEAVRSRDGEKFDSQVFEFESLFLS
jgi:hypothetical protein